MNKKTKKNLSNEVFCYPDTLLNRFIPQAWQIFIMKSFISNYKKVNKGSQQLINNKQNVWTNKYNLWYILPWNLAKIFYAEYGAYADREYMTIKDYWSRVIEGTHALFCGFFSLLSIYFLIQQNETKYTLCMAVGMGSQLMNSILYMSEYFIQTKNKDNDNNDDATGFKCLNV